MSIVEKGKFIREYVTARGIDCEKFWDVVTLGGYVKGNKMYGMVVDKVKKMTKDELIEYLNMWIGVYNRINVDDVLQSFAKCE